MVVLIHIFMTKLYLWISDVIFDVLAVQITNTSMLLSSRCFSIYFDTPVHRSFIHMSCRLAFHEENQ